MMNKNSMQKIAFYLPFLTGLLFCSNMYAQILAVHDYKYNPSSIEVTFDSEPTGARVIVDGKFIGITPITSTISVSNTLKDRYSKSIEQLENESQIHVLFIKDGITESESLRPKIEKNFSYYDDFQIKWPEGLFHLFKKGNSISEPSNNQLTNKIIRWYFESEPQGARIFWRVISSVPDQVKNTNELWLGSTPFEETRSFNIQGLTYENARDVQIEIKVRRNGYIDQTKRFNVRQAIDQQEISCFFDLIKVE